MWGDLPPHRAGDFHSVVQLHHHSWRLSDSQDKRDFTASDGPGLWAGAM